MFNLKEKLLDLDAKIRERYPDNTPDRKPKEPEKPLLSFEVSIVGGAYQSSLSPKKSRQQIIAKVKPGDVAYFQAFIYDRAPAYYVLRGKNEDIGCLPKDVSLYIDSMVKKPLIRGVFTDVNAFASKVSINVFGTLKNEYRAFDGAPGTRGKEYSYTLEHTDPVLLPTYEVYCDVKETPDGFNIEYNGNVISTISDERKDNLARMLSKYECVTTLLYNPVGYLKMLVRF